MSRKLVVCLGFGILNLIGCGQSDTAPPAAGCVDFAALPSTPQISFQNDLMPIFGLSCIASSCHDTSAHKANLVLGDPSACGAPGTSCYDPTAKWKYKFPGPIPGALLNQVLSNLVGAPSATNPAAQRVSIRDPDHSFLIDKIAGLQNSKQYGGPCTNQDPSRPAGPCGSDMPLNSPNMCADAPDKVQAIAMWIQQGAQAN